MMDRYAAAAWLATAFLSCGGGGGGTPSGSTNPPADDGRGSFHLSGAGYNQTNSYSAAGGNLIFCRREDPLPNTIWVRLAADRAGNGEQAPHIDIDLCNFAGTSTYSRVHDVSGPRSCNQGQTFAVWWHDGPSRVYVSRPISSPCSVSVTRGATTIDGTFECRGLEPETGTGDHLDVTAGSFHCSFQ